MGWSASSHKAGPPWWFPKNRECLCCQTSDRRIVMRTRARLITRVGFMSLVGAFLLWIAVYAASVTPVVTFAPPNFPESIAIDKEGNTYVAMFPTGEVRKIAPDGTQSTLA